MIFNRTRTMGSNANAGASVQVTEWPVPCPNGTNVRAPQTFGQAIFGHKKLIMDRVNPGFRARAKKGEIILSPLYILETKNRMMGSSLIRYTQKTTQCTPPVNYWYELRGQVFYYRLYSYGGNPGLFKILTDAEGAAFADEIWTKCLADVQKGLANYVESLAELDKAFAMLADPLENVITLVKDLRRSAKRENAYLRVASQSRAYVRFVSSEWLRFRYGITPMVSDIQAALKVLKKKFDDKEPKLIRTRASGTAAKFNVLNVDLSPYDGGCSTLKYDRTDRDTLSVRAVSFDKYTPTPWIDLGLSPHNLFGVWWELTRYSFVLDWFANVGDLIYANLPRANVAHLGGVCTSKKYSVTTYAPTVYSYAPCNAWSLSGALTDYLIFEAWETFRQVRSDGGALVVKNDFRLDNWKRALDAATLSFQWLNTIGFTGH